MDGVPDDLAPGEFYPTLVAEVLARLPVAERSAARSLYNRRLLPTAELDGDRTQD